MQEGRTQKTARNALFALISQGVTIILSFVSRSVFIMTLGNEYVGISGLFSDILTMLSLADLGLISAMSFSYYKPLKEGNKEKIASLLRFYEKIYHFLAIAVALIGIALIPFLGYIVNLESEIPYLTWYYLFFLANTVVSYLFVYKTTLINADQKNYIISKYTAIINMLKTTAQVICLLLFSNYFIYLSLNILSTILNNLLASRKANKLYPYINGIAEDPSKEEKKSIFENIKSVFIYKTGAVVMNGTVNTIISILIGTVWVGYYSNYNLIIGSLNTVINLLYTATTASIGNVIVSENKENSFNTFKIIQSVSLMLTMLTTVCLAELMDDFIRVWLGQEFMLDSFASTAIMLNFYVVGIVHPIWSFREATGLFRETKYIMPLCALANILLSLLLGYFWGIGGILLACVASRLITYFWYEPRILFRKHFGVSSSRYFLPLLSNFALTGIFSLILYFALSFIQVNGWLMWLLKACIVGIAALIFTLVCYCKTEGFILLKDRLARLTKQH